MTHQLTRDEARRIVVRAQLLDADRPGDVVEVAEQLGYVKIDPTATIAPCEHTVLWSRIGWSYEAGQLTKAVEIDRLLFEFDGAFRPVSLLPMMLPAMRRWPRRESTRQWLDANSRFRTDVLARLKADGPLLAADIPDTAQVSRAPDGWSGSNQVPTMLDFLMRQGQVAIVGREGRHKRWDLAERVYPADLPEYPEEEAKHMLRERTLQAAGIAKEGDRWWNAVGKAGEPAAVEGSKWKFRVDPDAIAALADDDGGRVAFLNPYDGMLFDRPRLEEVFEFTYVLEQFKPKPQRRYGFFAHPDSDRRSIRRDAGRRGRPRARRAQDQRGARVPPVRAGRERDGARRDRRARRLARCRRVRNRLTRGILHARASKPALRTEVLTAGRKEPPPKEDNVRKTIAAGVVAGFALAAGFVVPAQAISATSADLYVLHAIPDTPVDVYVNGALTLDDFQPGDLAGPLDLPAGDYEVALTAPDAADDSAPILGPATITLAAGTSYTATANLDEGGDPALNLFTNDIATTNAGEGRLTVRHVAAAPRSRHPRWRHRCRLEPGQPRPGDAQPAGRHGVGIRRPRRNDRPGDRPGRRGGPGRRPDHRLRVGQC